MKYLIIALLFFACKTPTLISPDENKAITISWDVEYPYNDSLDLGGTNVNIWDLRLIVNEDTIKYPNSYTLDMCDTISFITIFHFDFRIDSKYHCGQSYREYVIDSPGKNVYITQVY